MAIREPVFVLGEERPPIALVTDLLADFIARARETFHLAIYDFRLGEARAAAQIAGALIARADAGVDVRIVYDHRRQPKFGIGDDPAPHGTDTFLKRCFSGSRVKIRDVCDGQLETTTLQGARLLHDKYAVIDGYTKRAAVWTGSTNFNDDAWTVQDNNVVIVDSPTLSAYYETDFGELWSTREIGGTGVNDGGRIDADGLRAEVWFSPNCPLCLDERLARVILGARASLHVASTMITSEPIVDALLCVAEAGRVSICGAVDGPLMDVASAKVEDAGRSDKHARLGQLQRLLARKRSTPYAPTGLHDSMQNKVVVADDAVWTGSANFSSSARYNAENALLIEDARVAQHFRDYIEALVRACR